MDDIISLLLSPSLCKACCFNKGGICCLIGIILFFGAIALLITGLSFDSLHLSYDIMLRMIVFSSFLIVLSCVCFGWYCLRCITSRMTAPKRFKKDIDSLG